MLEKEVKIGKLYPKIVMKYKYKEKGNVFLCP